MCVCVCVCVCVCAQSFHTCMHAHSIRVIYLWVKDVTVAVFYCRISYLVMLIDLSHKLYVAALIFLH